MRKRFIAIFLAGGLMLWLCGCGSSGTALPPEAMAEAETENTSAYTTEDVLPEVWYTADDLLEMWDAGTLTKEDVIEMAEAGEMNDDVFREMMDFIAREEELAVRTEVAPESEESIVDVDATELLTTRSVEFEDMEGYTIRETCQLSPIFTEDDMETMHALWVALGNDIAIFPSYESMFDSDHRDNCDRLEYVIGTYMVENLTDGFSIVADNPRSYDGVLIPIEDGKTPAQYKEDAANHFRYDVVTMVSYSDEVIYYGSSTKSAGLVCDVKMESDTWGPRTFIMAVPNCSIPNRPDGYRYDNLTLVLCGNHHMNREEFITFELSYYSKEVE